MNNNSYVLLGDNSSDRQVMISGNPDITTYSWTDGTMTASDDHAVGNMAISDANEVAAYTDNRLYLHFNMPVLPINPRIKKAELVLYQKSTSINADMPPKLGLFHVTQEIATGFVTPTQDTRLLDYELIKVPASDETNPVSYHFDITRLIDAVNQGEVNCRNLVLQLLNLPDEECGITLYGTSDSAFAPAICLTYENSYAVDAPYRTHSHALGRFGQGAVDLICGNLMFETVDFAWAGGRMPVTLKHLYNSALGAYQYTQNTAVELETADFSAMKLGPGWKLNVMQSMKVVSFIHDGARYDGYIYMGENSDVIWFRPVDGEVNIFEAIHDNSLRYNSTNRTLEQGSDTYLFDEVGRLTRITDNHDNSMDITYTDNRITEVTDGAGRSFTLAYNSDGQLISITAPDETRIVYEYANGQLTRVTYSDNTVTDITYTGNTVSSVAIKNAANESLYTVHYTFANGRVVAVDERGKDGKQGAVTSYTRLTAERTVSVQTTEPADTDEGETSDHSITTIYSFDDDGNVISEYVYAQGLDNAAVSGSGNGVHPYHGSSINTIHISQNLFGGHNLENGESPILVAGKGLHGNQALVIHSDDPESREKNVAQALWLTPGTYTLSAYMRVEECNADGFLGAYIQAKDVSGNVLARSEYLSRRDTEYVRLAETFTVDTYKSVTMQFLLDGAGTVYADALQVEENTFASPYNLLENGDWERQEWKWTMTEGVEPSNETQSERIHCLKMTGDLDAVRNAMQPVIVRPERSARETFTLFGWAKACAVPARERDGGNEPQFRLRAVIHYNDADYGDTSTETFTADFSPCAQDWQYSAVQFSKSKYRTVDHIEVFCDYDYNFGVAYFDDIQLVRDNLETGLAPEDFPAEVDAYIADEETDTATDTVSTPEFEEITDIFGNNLTETTYTDGEFGTLYRAFGYTEDGNDLIRETDTRGNVTTYTVDPVTSRNQAVTDRCGNQTHYEYDGFGRTTKVISKDAENVELANVSYDYDAFDNLTEIARGDGLKYTLACDAFHQLESIGVDGKAEKLVTYGYKPGNGRLKQVTYANGHTMKATYNSLGQMVAEKWYDADGVLTAHYKYTFDNQGNLVRSIDIFAQKEYSYIYEEGRIAWAKECDIVLDENELITAKTLAHSLRYYYDREGNLIRKTSQSAGREFTTCYEYPENGSPVATLSISNTKRVTSHSKTDSFGRKVFDELQLGHGNVYRQFLYHAGQAPSEYTGYYVQGSMKSAPTTNLVSQILLSDGRTLSYEYDAEERITKVTESDGKTYFSTTEYTYDALGQLLTETHNGTVVNRMEYDNYGNILTKNGKWYTYGDEVWKDKLTKVGEDAITYDAQGNPTSYLGHTLTWEKGRQLKSFDGNTYTYNANGIRTSKTVNGVKHTYTLDGTKILRETWGNEQIIPLYDNEDSICGLIYGKKSSPEDAGYVEESFFFLKNLQGDIIAITDQNGKVVAKYAYDAWGKCTIVEDTSERGIATVNPFRYRSYYYDPEIGMYYLQSRYYDPVVGRFVNADGAEWIGTNDIAIEANIFCYCRNNCVNRADETGYGGIDKLLDALNSCVDIIAKMIDMMGNSFNKERKQLESSVKLLTKKQGRYLSNIKALQNQAEKLSKRLGWIGHGITFLVIAIGFAASYKSGKNIDHSIIELTIESFIALIEYGAGKFFEWIAKFIPYVGFLLGLVAGWLISYLLGKYFNTQRVNRIKDKFSSLVKNARVSLINWIRSAVKSLFA